MDTLADLQAELVDLRAARRRLLTGCMVTQIGTTSGACSSNVSRAPVRLADIDQAIALAEAKVSRLTGDCAGCYNVFHVR